MKKEIKHLSVEDFEKVIKDKKVWLLDVREPYEFQSGHIKRARLIPSTCFEEEFRKLRVKEQEPIALYCRSGKRSFFVAEKLIQKGFQKVYNLEEGLIAWRREGKEVVK